jgi:mannonate dehydratase
VKGDVRNFQEAWHDDGITDMRACLEAYRDIGFEGVLRPDHVPTVEGDSNENAGYSSFGRLYAIGYIRGLREAVYGQKHE